MEFVFSAWYFVMIALVVGIVACVVVLFKMNKKDQVLIDKFIKDSAEGSKNEEQEEVKKEEKAEVKEDKAE